MPLGSWRIPTLIIACILLSALFQACGTSLEPADVVLRNGKIVTVEENLPEVEALAIHGDTITALGTDQEMEPYIGPETEVIDLEGKLAVPGFIESHGNFIGIGRAKMELDLTTAKNWDEVIQMVEEAVQNAQPGDWILGRGWQQDKWDLMPSPNVEGFPTHASLSRISPENPVFLTHADGHSSFANAKAMELAEITRSTPNPPGGEILHDARGNPVGIFRGTASGLIRRAYAHDQSKRTGEQILADDRKEIELAIEECLSKGITSFQDSGSSFENIDLLKQLADEGELGLRLWVMVKAGNEELEEKISRYRIQRYGDKHLTVRAINVSMDGELGPRGAWLIRPYEDLASSTGLNTTPVETVGETARIAIENDFQLCVDCVGDRANREALDLFEEAFQSRPEKRNLRWRIEHAQHLNPDDIPRFGNLGVIASMQGVRCTSEAPFVTDRLGAKRAEEGAFVWQRLMHSGAIICNGTDAPVEDVDPIACYYSTVSRKLMDGSVFYPDQRMTREEALQSYTYNAAFAAFEEDIKGSLAAGKLADITVLSKDILTIPEEEIPTVQVIYTIVGGKVMYRR